MGNASALTAASIKSTLTKHVKDRKSYGGVSTFLVGEDNDGALWYTNSYYAAKVDAKSPTVRQPVAVQFFQMFNLTPAQGVYPLNGTLSASTGDGPRIGALVPKDDAWGDIEPLKVADMPALVMAGGKLCRVHGADGAVIAFDDSYASWLELTAGVTEWKGQFVAEALATGKPLGGFNADDELVALLMPVRLG